MNIKFKFRQKIRSFRHEKRILYVAQAFREGKSAEEIHALTHIDPWFLNEIEEIVKFEKDIDMDILSDSEKLRKAKTWGFSDKMIAHLINQKDNLELSQNDVYYAREKHGIKHDYYEVDTCAGEFPALTPYLYSSVNISSNLNPLPVVDGKKVLIIGGGPNRIGQGIEFDYCCVHASYALRDMGVKSIMYNCNPETVSTDYDTSDVLYFEPIDFEHVRALIERENPDGVIVHFGGQTPLKFAKRISMIGARIIGTNARVIDVAEDRKKFSEFIAGLEGIKQPKNDTATSEEEAIQKAANIGYPVLVRPSYVLGGRAMRRVANESELKQYMSEAVHVSNNSPVLLDKFLQDATELDVDAISDSKDVYIGAIMEHVEEAGIHSGDSASILPPRSLSPEMIERVENATKQIALNLGVVGLMNIQFAIFEGELYIIEVNPRASRTVPFVSKATGLPLAKVATRVMWQGNLVEALKFYDKFGVVKFEKGVYKARMGAKVCVKESVFPFNKLPGADLILGPEMKSTGEVMGISDSFEKSFIKSQIAAKNAMPKSGNVFISLADADKEAGVKLARKFVDMGFCVLATGGTYKRFSQAGVPCEMVYKISEGRPNIEDKLKNGDIALAVNTSDNKSSTSDAAIIRQAVLRLRVPYFTNMRSALIAADSIGAIDGALEVKSLQEYLR